MLQRTLPAGFIAPCLLRHAYGCPKNSAFTLTLIRPENEHDLAVDRLSTTIWSGGAAAGLYLGDSLPLSFRAILCAALLASPRA
jgi:hypothetical protein